MSNPAHGRRLPSLPREVIEEIMVRLPVAALMRFTAVCKQWHALIQTDRRFNEVHFRHAIRSGDHPWRRGSVTSQSTEGLSDSENIIVALDSTDCYGNREVVSISGLGTPGSTNPRVCGSCDGLLLVHIHSLEFIIWNPYTRAFRRIAIADDPPVSEHYNIISGLGYDHKTDDHKAVVIIRDASKGPSPVQAFVYSARKKSWTCKSMTSDDFPYKIQRDVSGITAKGSPHWVLRRPAIPWDIPAIISFDTAEEKIKEVPLPEELVIKQGDTVGAATKGELLCLFVLPPSGAGNSEKLWVREEHTLGKSWTSERYFLGTSYDGALLSRNNITLEEEYKELQYARVDRGAVRRSHSFLTVSCDMYVQSLLHPWEKH